MKTTTKISNQSRVIPLTPKAKERMSVVAENIKGKELFPEKIESAKKILKKIKSLPI